MSEDATVFLSLLVGWGGGHLPVFLDGAPVADTTLSLKSPAAAGVELARRAARWDFDMSRQVEVGLPMARKGLGVGACSVLWCWCETRDSVARAHRWKRKPPTMVLRMGGSCRRLLLWALKDQAHYESVLAANRRVAYALHAPQKWAAPESLRIPVPGTFLRVGRARPSPVVVTLMEFDRSYALEDVTRGLRDPPPRDAWRNRAAR